MPTLDTLKSEPTTAKCDALGQVRVSLLDVSLDAIRDFELIIRDRLKEQRDSGTAESKAEAMRASVAAENAAIEVELESSKSALEANSSEPPMHQASNMGRALSPPTSLEIVEAQETNSQEGAMEPQADKLPKGFVDSLTGVLRKAKTSGSRLSPSRYLDLPLLVIEHKKDNEGLLKGINQMRLHLTACVKFLHVIGVQEFIVYGMLTNGPQAIFPAAVMNADGVCTASFLMR